MILLGLLCAAAGAYQLIALVACLAHMRRRDALSSQRPPVSILKPIYGADDHFYPAIVSHAQIVYPEFEILFGIRDPHDTAVPFIKRLQAEYPHIPIRIVLCSTLAPNGKVGTLIDLAREAHYNHFVVNDSDIVVPPDYLDRVTAPLEDHGIGLVTCLYRAGADTLHTQLEALGIATDFTPSALVAPLVGVKEFGLGSTLAFRREHLEALGGFESIAHYIADDYQFGKRTVASGKRVHLLRMPVETHLGSGTWKSVWDHQVRWARTIRLSRGAYFGLPIANATLWALLALLGGAWQIAAALVALRLITGLAAGLGVLHDGVTRRQWWLMPLRDLAGFAVWLTAAFGNSVLWRGKRLDLDREGRILGGS